MTQSPRATIARNTPNIAVVGVGGGGGNAINNMIAEGIGGVDFIAANTDAQALKKTNAPRLVQLSSELTGLERVLIPRLAGRLRSIPSTRSWIT